LKSLRSKLYHALTNITHTVQIAGRPYAVPLVHSNALLREVHRQEAREPWLENLLGRLLAMREGAFVDVGANVGQTMLVLLGVEPERRYVGFEPQIRACQLVQAFIDRNGIDHFTILPIGLSDENGILTLNSRALNDVSASLVAQYRPDGFHPKKHFVPVMTGDDVLAQIGAGPIAVIKIDVEGGELAVMRGLSNTIGRQMPPIVFEILPDKLLITGEVLDPETRAFRHQLHAHMAAELHAHGYGLFEVDDAGALLPRNTLEADEKRLRNFLAIEAGQLAVLQQS